MALADVPRSPMRRSLLVAAIAAPLTIATRMSRADNRGPACSARLRMALPPTPALPTARESSHVTAGAAVLWFADFGDPDSKADPIVLLHGGLANSDYWGGVLPLLLPSRRVIVLDTRGHGRSTLGGSRLGYALLATDVIRVLDHLRIARAAIGGWSDGGITGLVLGMTYQARISRLFTFGANFDASGVLVGNARSATFREFSSRSRAEYRRLSPEPGGYDQLSRALERMWREEPRFKREYLARVTMPTTVAGAEFDEIIIRQHTAALAAAIPGARLVIQPCLSHFALLQDPLRFSHDLLAAL